MNIFIVLMFMVGGFGICCELIAIANLSESGKKIFFRLCYFLCRLKKENILQK